MGKLTALQTLFTLGFGISAGAVKECSGVFYNNGYVEFQDEGEMSPKET